MTSRSTPEMLFSRLLLRRNFFRPFHWKDVDVKPLVNGVSSNSSFLKNKLTLKSICNKYPLKEDIEDFVDGIFLSKEVNIHSLSSIDVSQAIVRLRKSKKYIDSVLNEGVKLVNETLISKYTEEDLLGGKSPKIFDLFKSGQIPNVVLSDIYLSYQDNFQNIVQETKNVVRSLERSIFLNEIFRGYKIVKMLKSK